MSGEGKAMQLEEFLTTLDDSFRVVGAVLYDEAAKELMFSPHSEVYPYIKLPAAMVASVTPLRKTKILAQGGWKDVSVASLQLNLGSSEEAKFLKDLYSATIRHLAEHFSKEPSTSGGGCSCGGGEVKIMGGCGCLNLCAGICNDGHCTGVCV